MNNYIDGFVLLVPKKNVKAYKKLSENAGKIWMEYGALQYVETIGDDLKVMKGMRSFTKLAKPGKNEVVIFSWIMYKSKKDRNKINKKVMKDKRITEEMKNSMPFDVKKMTYGGFSSIVNKWR